MGARPPAGHGTWCERERDGLVVGPFAHYLADGTAFFTGTLDELGQLTGEVRVMAPGEPLPRLRASFRGGVPHGEYVRYVPASQYADAHTQRSEYRDGQPVGKLLMTKLDGTEAMSPQPNIGSPLQPAPQRVFVPDSLQVRSVDGDRREQRLLVGTRRYGLEIAVGAHGWLDALWTWSETIRHLRVLWQDGKPKVYFYDEHGNLDDTVFD